MNYQTTIKKACIATARASLLALILLLTACDGGIFGTGGVDTDESIASVSAPEPADGTISTSDSQATDDGATAGTIDPGIAGEGSEGSADGDEVPVVEISDDGGIDDTSGVEDVVATPGFTDGGADGTDSGTTDNGGIADGGLTDDGTTGITTGGITGGGTDGGVTDGGGNTDSGIMPIEPIASETFDGEFVNNTPTLDVPQAQLTVVNTSALTLNIISPSTSQQMTLLEIADVAPNTIVANTVISSNVNDLAVVDSNNPPDVSVTYTTFNVAPSTLTTLLVRNNESDIDALTLVTETQTSDASLAKVRVIQSGALGDASVTSELLLQSAGTNPGGVDASFGPLSFDNPQSDYMEIFAGDYELIDLANRITPIALTLTGGNVYTLLLNGDGVNNVLIINDTEGALLVP